MAIFLKNNSVFLHIPKTGGKWVISVLEEFDLIKFNFSHNHADMERTVNFHRHFPWHFMRQTVKHGCYLPKIRKAFKFCFVRHPLTYYESYYKYALQLGWPEGNNPMGKMPGNNSWHPNSPLFMPKPKGFNDFIKGVVKRHPGYVTELYSSYTSPSIDFIGKTENLADDLIKVLTIMGINVPEEKVRSYPTQNVSKTEEVNIVWDAELKKEVLKLEYAALVRYGYI
jgi:hypothetical protein